MCVLCNIWDAHMGSVIPMTAAAVPFYYMLHKNAVWRCFFSVSWYVCILLLKAAKTSAVNAMKLSLCAKWSRHIHRRLRSPQPLNWILAWEGSTVRSRGCSTEQREQGGQCHKMLLLVYLRVGRAASDASCTLSLARVSATKGHLFKASRFDCSQGAMLPARSWKLDSSVKHAPLRIIRLAAQSLFKSNRNPVAVIFWRHS